jgi:hypothetical protein
MKYLILTVLLFSTGAYAADAPTGASGEPSSVSAAAPQPSPQTAPPPAAVPVQPTSWAVMDLDKRDLQDINNWAQSCPKQSADPFIALLNAKIKALK